MNEYTSLLLTVIQYAVFALLIAISLVFLYKGLFDEYSRRLMRKRFVSHMEMQKQKAQVNAKASEVTDKFEKAQVPYINNVRYAIIRMGFILFLLVGFGLGTSLTTTVLIVAVAILATEPLLKYSAINLYLNQRLRKIKDEKEGELFTLFALFKTDIMSDTKPQINVFTLVNRNLTYFDRIRPTLIRFLQMWTKSPEAAGKVFANELSGDSAEFLGDFMGKLNSMNRTDAVHLLEEQSEIFSHKRSEQVMQKAEIQRNGYFLFFFISAFASIAWFMWFMYDMTARSMNF